MDIIEKLEMRRDVRSKISLLGGQFELDKLEKFCEKNEPVLAFEITDIESKKELLKFCISYDYICVQNDVVFDQSSRKNSMRYVFTFVKKEFVKYFK